MNNTSCICNKTTNGLYCSIHGIERIPFITNTTSFENEFIKELKRQNKIKAKLMVKEKSTFHDHEVKVKLRKFK